MGSRPGETIHSRAKGLQLVGLTHFFDNTLWGSLHGISQEGLTDVGRKVVTRANELMKRVAGKGGIIGVGYWDAATCDYSPMGVVKSIRYGIDLLGLEHVALAPITTVQQRPRSTPRKLPS